MAVATGVLLREGLPQRMRVGGQPLAQRHHRVALAVDGPRLLVHDVQALLVGLDEPALDRVLLLQLLQLLHVLLQLHVDHLDLLAVPKLLVELHLQALRLLLEELADHVHAGNSFGAHRAGVRSRTKRQRLARSGRLTDRWRHCTGSRGGRG